MTKLIVLIISKNEVNVTKHVNNIREDETATYADSKELNKWSMECRYTTRDNTRGWLEVQTTATAAEECY